MCSPPVLPRHREEPALYLPQIGRKCRAQRRVLTGPARIRRPATLSPLFLKSGGGKHHLFLLCTIRRRWLCVKRNVISQYLTFTIPSPYERMSACKIRLDNGHFAHGEKSLSHMMYMKISRFTPRIIVLIATFPDMNHALTLPCDRENHIPAPPYVPMRDAHNSVYGRQGSCLKAASGLPQAYRYKVPVH